MTTLEKCIVAYEAALVEFGRYDALTTQFKPIIVSKFGGEAVHKLIETENRFQNQTSNEMARQKQINDAGGIVLWNTGITAQPAKPVKNPAAPVKKPVALPVQPEQQAAPEQTAGNLANENLVAGVDTALTNEQFEEIKSGQITASKAAKEYTVAQIQAALMVRGIEYDTKLNGKQLCNFISRL